MKIRITHGIFAATLILLLAACSQSSTLPNTQTPPVLGLLKVTISGIGEGASPTATAEWVKPGASSGASSGVKGQAATVVPVFGDADPGDVQFIRRNVGFLDNDVAGTRNVMATFDLVNRTTINFANFQLYAVHKDGQSIGGTGVVQITSGNGAAITDPAVARGFKPTHGMRGLVQGLEVNPHWADLQFYTSEEVDNPLTGIKQQAVALGLLSAPDIVLEYGFVARNFSGGRSIAARSGADCTTDACKGAVTLAYQLPKVSPRQNNPFSFSLYFIVANEPVSIGSQSLEEQSANTVMGLANPSPFAQLRTLAGTNFQGDALYPVCRARYAVLPDLFMGPDPIPTPSGSLDLCFGASGKRITDFASRDFANALALQPDGKMVLAGHSGVDFALARYTPSGALDTTFDSDGRLISAGNGVSEAYGVAIQGDGKIVVAGYSGAPNNADFAVVRYNPNGSLDTTFDTDGKVFTSIGSGDDQGRAVALQADGKIVVAGYAQSGSQRDIAVVRYNPNGSLDTSFDSDGKVRTQVGSFFGQANAVAIQSDGKIVVAGTDGNDFVWVRYTAGGSVDTSVTTDMGSNKAAALALALDSSGRIVVAGGSGQNISEAFVLARYNASGSLDTSFGTGGILFTTIGQGNNEARSLAIQSDGKIVVAGYTFNGSAFVFGLMRLNSNGSFDTTFDTDGKATTDFGSSAAIGNALLIQGDGKIVVGGTRGPAPGENFILARYNP